MYEGAEAAGVRHMTAFTYRFVPAMRYLKHLLGQGVAGLPRHLPDPHAGDKSGLLIGGCHHLMLLLEVAPHPEPQCPDKNEERAESQ